MSRETVFETERLRIRTAGMADTELLHRLWTDPRVMRFVGFPRGLSITVDQIADDLTQGVSTGAFDRCLLVELRSTGEVIGECRLGTPDEAGIAETDVKLFPEHWGHRYGVEVKRGLVEHLFINTYCVAVQATPNVENAASIVMQEAVGGVRVGEVTFEPPEGMRDQMTAVHSYVYRVHREDRDRACGHEESAEAGTDTLPHPVDRRDMKEKSG